MPPYLRLGSIPRKRHIAHRARAGLQGRRDLLRRSRHDRRLLAGLQHRLPPAAADAGAAARAGRDDPVGLRRAAGAPASSPQDAARCRAPATRSPAASLLFGNDDVTLARCRPERAAGRALPQRRRRRGHLRPSRPRASCTRCSARCRFATSTTSSSRAARPIGSNSSPAASPTCSSSRRPATSTIPAQYLNPDGQLRLGAPYSERDLHGPREIGVDRPRAGDDRSLIKDGRRLTRYTLANHPFDVVGWDGMVYPYTFNADDFEPITGTVHQPPPVQQTFDAPGFVVCTFAPRMLDTHPEAIKVPLRPLERAGRRGAVLRARPIRQPARRRGGRRSRSTRAASRTARTPARSSPAATSARPTSWP